MVNSGVKLYTIKFSSRFKKDFKRVKNNKKNYIKLLDTIELLADGKTLDKSYNVHKLNNDGTYKDCIECHICPDLLLVYKYDNNDLILYLIRTGNHSELF